MSDTNAAAVCSLLAEEARNILRRDTHAIPDQHAQDRQKDYTEACAEMHLLGTDLD